MGKILITEQRILRYGLILVLLLLISALLGEDIVQPLYFIDEDAKGFSDVIVHDSIIYAIGYNYDNSFLYKFDLQLNLLSKVRICQRLFTKDFSLYQDGFLIKSGMNNEFTYINMDGEVVRDYHLKGAQVLEFEKDGYTQIITRQKSRLYLYKICSDLSQTEERLILEIGIDWKILTSYWKLYYDEKGYNLFYEAKESIIKYSFTNDWVLFHQAVIIDKAEDANYKMQVEENRIILSEYEGDKCFTYDFEGNLISSGIKAEESVLEKDIELITSDLRDSLAVISHKDGWKFQLNTDFVLSQRYYEMDNYKIILAGSKSYFPDWGMYREALIMVLDSPKSELYLHQNSATDSLESAYIADDSARLADLFSEWQKKHEPEIKTAAAEYEKEAYILVSQIYPELYKLHKEHYNKYHSFDAEFKVELTDTIRVSEEMELAWNFNPKKSYSPGMKRVLPDFHPFLGIDKEVIYIDKSIRKALLCFFAHSNKDDEDLRQRMKFLSKYIHIQGLHWSGKPNLHSQPAISHLVFDVQYEKAIVFYVLDHGGSSFLCKKIDGKWKKVKGFSSWIQ
ncbi:MAG: hypothetical protein K9M99_10925 [Candidatus Cloacimonetes bacterium]|nr:hypothetical protein [Candidatus Cloacimonadota bacterium]